jgi:hypothetical protein
MSSNSFFGIDLEGVKCPVESEKMPKKAGVLVHTTLGTIMAWIIKGCLHPYINNRGDGRLSNNTSLSAKSGVNVNSLGECTIGLFESEGETRMTLADFHSRLAGFMERHKNGDMTKTELDTPISVRVAVDFMDSYRQLNASDPHRNKHKIRNPDLAYGPIVQQIFDSVSEECIGRIGANKWTILSSIIYNMTLPNKDWNWPKVYQKRQIAGKLSNELAGSIQITQKEMKRLIVAIEGWNQLMAVLEEKAKDSGINVSKIVGNAGLFGFMVCDRMWAVERLSSNPVLVKRILRNLPSVMKSCPELCRGNRQMVEICTGQLEGMLRRKDKVDLDEIAA